MADTIATPAVAQENTNATTAAQATQVTTQQPAATPATPAATPETPATQTPAATPATTQVQKPADGTILNKTETSDVVPEKYEDFKVPEGFNAPQESFKTFAKEIGMSQEKAQKTIDYYTSKFVPEMQEAHNTVVKCWAEQSNKELGKEGIDTAIKAYQALATPELRQLMGQTGLGSNPTVLKMFKAIGEKMKESNLVPGEKVTTPKRGCDVMFNTVDK